RCDTITRIYPVAVDDGFTRRGGGIIIQMKDLDSLATEHSQTQKSRFTLIKVEQIRQHTRFLVISLNRYEYCLSQLTQCYLLSPKLQLWDHTHLVAKFQQGAVPFRDLKQADLNSIGRPCRRRCYALAANPGHHVHIPPGLFHALGPLCRIVYNPLREGNRALHGQSQIRYASAQ